MTSIRARLLAGLMAGAFICCAIALGMLYLLADAEADEQADLRLRQVALNLPVTVYDGTGWPSDTDPDEQIVLQLWQDGRVVHASGPASMLPLRVRDGYRTADHGGQRWRTFAAPHGHGTVQVAQPVAVRQQQAVRMALRIALPFAFLLPALGMLIWIVVGRALAPVSALAAAVAGASPRDLRSFEVKTMPPELAPIVAALNSLLVHIGRAMRTQRDFVTDAAHELRSPLAALKLELQIAERAADSVPAARLSTQFAGIRLRLDRATHMVNQLISLARHEADGAAETGRRCTRDLQALARASIAEHARDAEMRDIDLGLAADSAAVNVPVDAEALMVGLRNLIDNALRHTPEGGKVDIGAGVLEGRAFLRVGDNGPGIAAHERERVFDRFFRGEQAGTAREATGCGLGMAIVKSVAESHGAQVLLGDAPGGGLTATILFAPGSAA